jgi:hypothetical membrane protein
MLTLRPLKMIVFGLLLILFGLVLHLEVLRNDAGFVALILFMLAGFSLGLVGLLTSDYTSEADDGDG